MSVEKIKEKIHNERKIASRYELLISMLSEKEANECMEMLKKAKHNEKVAKKHYPVIDVVIAKNLKVYTVNDQDEIKDKDLTKYDVVVFDCDIRRVKDFSNCPPKMIFEGDVDLSYMYVKKLPDLSQSVVLGNFDCVGNLLTNLEGAPKEVFGDFVCSEQHAERIDDVDGVFRSFDGAPKSVWGGFYCHNVDVASFKGLSEHIEVGPCFDTRVMNDYKTYYNCMKKERISKKKEEYRKNSKIGKFISKIFNRSK